MVSQKFVKRHGIINSKDSWMADGDWLQPHTVSSAKISNPETLHQ